MARISISPTAAIDPLLSPPQKILMDETNNPSALDLLAAATAQSQYLPAEENNVINTPTFSEPPASNAVETLSNPTAATATLSESIPQDVAFSPGRQDNRIPKKANLPAPIGSFDGLQLPPGIVLPDSVTPEILGGKPMRMLLELPQQAMKEALLEFDSAVKERGSEIRSLPAYLVGVIKRYRTIQQASRGGAGQLSDSVLARLDRLISSGFCSQLEIDDKIKTKLAMMTESEQLSAIDELCQVKREDIRSFSSYFMGILNRYANNRVRDPNKFGQNNNNKTNRWGHSKQNNDVMHSGGSGKCSHYGRSSGQDSKNDRHGKDSSRGSRDDGHRRSRSRSRSRDRHSRRRHRSYSSSTSRSRSRSDSRDRSRRRRRRRSRSDSRDRDRHRSDRNTKSRFGNAIPPPPPPRPGKAIPPPSEIQQRVNDQQLEQLFRVPARAPPQVHHSQPNQQITLPANLSQQQIQALQAILQPNNAQPALAQAVVPTPAWPAQQAIPQQWQQQSATWSQAAAPTAPLDILNLAEKAAQALSAVPGHQNSYPPPPPPVQAMHHAVTEQDLSQMVQYALQNLRASGHIEATLDSNICGLLAKLPESNALLSLETFLGCDITKMRNKNAYLSGILRKELVRLGLS